MADLGCDLPRLGDLREILDQHLNWQPALDFKLAVDTGFCLLEDLVRQIGGEDVDSPPGNLRRDLPQTHGK
jgi:hypothetical protein